MKTYPSISHKIQYGVCAYVFDKIDGSNIRVEWQRKQGFCKFGSRKRLLGSDQGVLTEAESLMKNNFESELSDIFCYRKISLNCLDI